MLHRTVVCWWCWQIIDTYRGLTAIEESFKVIKQDLEGRPVHIRTRQHINAHFLTCFLALTMIRLIQHGMGGQATEHQIVQALATATCTQLEKNLWLIDETTPVYKQIEYTWHISLPVRYAPIETIRAYQRDINPNTIPALHKPNG